MTSARRSLAKTLLLPLLLLALAIAIAVLAPTAQAAPAAASDAPTSDPHAWLSRLEGGWRGEDNTTPMGRMPFAMVFDRDDDGSVHAHSGFNTETWIALRFFVDEHGRLSVEEAAAMEGFGKQSHVLVADDAGRPTDAQPATRHFVHPERPDYLTITATPTDDELDIDVVLRGEPHVYFQLDRIPDEEVSELRTILERHARRTPEETGSLADAMAQLAAEELEREHADDARADDDPGAHAQPDADPLAAARARVAQSPEDARAHMALAQALIAAIEVDPMSAPRHAGLLLHSLRRAHTLDPDWAAPYHGLVGYYLEAPPIAGGSLERAEEKARELARIDPEGAEQLLARIAARRADDDASTH